MPPTGLTVQQIERTGLNPSYVAVDGVNGNKFANDGQVYLHVKNNAVSPITVTVETPGLVDNLAVADRPVVVPNAQERIIGQLPPGIYNQADGTVTVTFSSATSVTAGAFRL